jgi:DNA adenine methylase
MQQIEADAESAMILDPAVLRLKKQESLKPPLKWAGGKRWLVPYMRPYWESHRHVRYVEPFCGGLAMPLGLRPARALLNDVNTHVVNFYRWVQHGLHIRIDMANDRDLFYEHRERFNTLIAFGQDNTREAAELFYFLNRTGFNGLCRFNRRGVFNVPFGKYRTINYMRDFSGYQRVLAPWTFQSGDFESLRLCDDDFIYADPPYDVPFTSYSKEGFNWADQVRLAKWLSRHSGTVIVSNQRTKRIIELYGDLGFDIRVLEAPRRISSDGNRAPAQEMLAIRYGRT